jgi:hypothetical protein
MRLKRKKSHTDSNSRPTFATTTIAVESPGKAGTKEDMTDLLSVTGESRMVGGTGMSP